MGGKAEQKWREVKKDGRMEGTKEDVNPLKAKSQKKKKEKKRT